MVLSSTILIAEIAESAEDSPSISALLSNEYLISSTVTGLPSWKVIPSLNVKVYVFASSEIV